MPRLTSDELARYLDDESPRSARRDDRARQPGNKGRDQAERPFRPRTRANERNPFKCGHCRAFIGPVVFGGRHRNHCPLCLTSRHVDHRKPGDRSSPCRALMPAVGVAYRANGEQMVVHRCNGCGIERQNRVAADDNPIALLHLPAVVLARGHSHEQEKEAIA
ncbi:MAG: RNHCP domain-containing protein [Thermomicrobiales bacterium]